MQLSDIIGIIGVSLILAAYFISVIRIKDPRGLMSYLLNALGAGIACYASILIEFWPFVILEAIWALVAIYGMVNLVFKKSI